MPNRSIGRYLAAGAATILAAGLLIHDYIKARRKSAPSDTAKETQDTENLSSPSDFIAAEVADNDRKAANKSHEAQEEDYWFWTKWAAIVAASGAIVASVFAGLAFYEALRQATAAEEANRPWISFFNVKMLTPLRFQYGIAAIGLQFELENSGHTPALWVDVQQIMFVRNPRSMEEMNKVKTVCARKRPTDFIYGTGSTIFPNQKATRRMNIVMDEKDTSYFRSHNDVVVMIAGCAEYVFTKHGEVHQTFFVAELDKKGSIETPFMALPRDRDAIPESDLVLVSNPSLEGYAD